MRLPAAALLFVASVAHAQAVLVDRIVAVVDMHCITRSSVEARAKRQQQPRETALNELIDRLLIARDAIKLGLLVTEAEVDAALAQVMAQNMIDRDTFMKTLAAQGFSLEEYREELGRQLLELRWLALRQNSSARPDGEEARAKFFASERQRLVGELKKKAAIEVRP